MPKQDYFVVFRWCGAAFSLYSFVQCDNCISTGISHGARQNDVDAELSKTGTPGNMIPFLPLRGKRKFVGCVTFFLQVDITSADPVRRIRAGNKHHCVV